MKAVRSTSPREFVAGFLTAFTEELVHSDEDPARIVDRYHTPDVLQIADGIRLDREALIAHAGPLRKRRPGVEIDVHEAMSDGDRMAARYTMRVRERTRALTIDVCLFGEFTPDGRMRRANMLTRELVEGGGPRV